jgi:hypothetical protein
MVNFTTEHEKLSKKIHYFKVGNLFHSLHGNMDSFTTTRSLTGFKKTTVLEDRKAKKIFKKEQSSVCCLMRNKI